MYHFFVRITFVIGFLLGIFIAVFLTPRPSNQTLKDISPFKHAVHTYDNWYSKHFGVKQKLISFDKLRYGNSDPYTLESKYLFSHINILCLVLSKQPKNMDSIEDTWGRGCNDISFINLVKEKMKVPLKVKTRSHTSWALLCKSLVEVPEKYDWIMVVNDYTFVIVENLRFFIASLDPAKQFYFGYPIRFWNTVYNLGQAGYVLSRGTVSMFKERMNSSASSCMHHLSYNNKEDYYLGKHLAALNITPVDTRDHEGLSTFHPYNWYHLFSPSERYEIPSIFPPKCCSKYSVTFQSIDGDKMYTYYYFLYTLQLFYDGNLGNQPRKQENDDKVWKQFLKERDLPLNITSEQYYQIWVDLVDDPASFATRMKKDAAFDYN